MLFTLRELANIANARLKGNPDCHINGVNTLKLAKQGEISFLSNRRYVRFLKTTQASAIILHERDVDNCSTNALISSDPYLAYAKVVNYLYPTPKKEQYVHASAVLGSECEVDPSSTISSNVHIGNNVRIGAQSFIGPSCVIEDNVIIGDNTQLVANVTLCCNVVLGNHIILHPGVVIGTDGFGFVQDKGRWLKLSQIGSVTLGNNVEIGANTTIDRGAIEDTIIESGVKIDNQVQIGHNVVIGEDTVIAGCCGIAGSTTIGKHCMIGGGVCINGHIEIVDNVVITAMSGVANSIKKSGVYSSAIPVTENRRWRRNVIRFQHLDETFRKIMKK